MGLVDDAVPARKLNFQGESWIKKMYYALVGVGLMGGLEDVRMFLPKPEDETEDRIRPIVPS